MRLQKSISNTGLLFTVLCVVVGSGWLLGPFYAARIAGPAAIISWILGAILMMVIAMTIAELGCMFPVTGGLVRYAHFSHGRFTGFTLAWISWISTVMLAPVETMAAIQYASNYIPALVQFQHGKHTLTHIGLLSAAGLMFLLCLINTIPVKLFSKGNNILGLWKIVIPLITVILLFSYHFHKAPFTHYGGFAPYGLHGILAALPAAGIVFSFMGYSVAVQFAGEAEEPKFAIPFAIIGAIIIACLLYTLIQSAFIGAVTKQALMHGWAHLRFLGDAGPIVGIVTGAGLLLWVKFIYVDAFISPAGNAYINTAGTARMNIGMADNDYMPNFMKKTNRYGSPIYAIFTNFIVGTIFFLPFPGWQDMVTFLVSAFVASYAIGPIACATLRYTKPDVKRVFKVPFPLIYCFIAFYFCNLMVYWAGWSAVWKLLVIVLIGYVLLFIQSHFRRSEHPLNLRKGIWLFPYFIGIAVVSYLGPFGGIKVIPFGVDFIILGVIALITYCIAIKVGVSYSNEAEN